MRIKRNHVVLAVVIILIVLIVLFFYLIFHSGGSENSSFSLGQYLNGLADAALDKEASTPTPTASTTVTNTSAELPVSGSAPVKTVPQAMPYLTVLSPAHGGPGLTVIIGGKNFDPSINYITFGSSDGQHSVNGLPDNVIAAQASPNGTTLTFNVPLYGPSELQCDSTGKNCVAVPATVLPDGSYAVTVKTKAGVSNQLYFTLTH